MNATTGLQLGLTASDGALRRVLGTVEHRGFRVHALHVESSADGTQYRVRLEVAGERDPELLTRQLLRLYDVHDVEVRPDMAAV
ncbi:MAG TPA: ACT domain-containing protein [Rhodanobacteraceae bacterium]